jgi:Protein of unknown function (DUF2384)
MARTALQSTEQPDPGRVLAKATVRASALLGLSGAALGRVIGLSPASVSRVSAGEKAIVPGSKEGELAALLVRVYRSLDALVGNDSAARLRWLSSYNEALRAVPKERMQSVQGLVEVVAYLDGMRAQN